MQTTQENDESLKATCLNPGKQFGDRPRVVHIGMSENFVSDWVTCLSIYGTVTVNFFPESSEVIRRWFVDAREIIRPDAFASPLRKFRLCKKEGMLTRESQDPVNVVRRPLVEDPSQCDETRTLECMEGSCSEVRMSPYGLPNSSPAHGYVVYRHVRVQQLSCRVDVLPKCFQFLLELGLRIGHVIHCLVWLSMPCGSRVTWNGAVGVTPGKGPTQAGSPPESSSLGLNRISRHPSRPVSVAGI